LLLHHNSISAQLPCSVQKMHGTNERTFWTRCLLCLVFQLSDCFLHWHVDVPG